MSFLTPIVHAQTVIATINVGPQGPTGIDVDPITTDVWVAEAGTFTGTGHNVTVISEKTFTVTATLTGLPTSPLDVAVNTKTNRAYVTFNPFCCSNGPINGGLVVINDKDHKPLATISPIQDPRGVAVDPLTNMIYVASFGTTFPFNCGCVIVIDGNTNVIVTTIPVPEGPLAIAVDPVTNRIYTGDYTNEVTVIDGSTNTVITNVAVAGSQALVGLGVGVNAATNRIYVSRYFGTNDVFVIDGSTDAVIADIPVGPQSNVSGGIGVDSVTNKVYVANADGSVSVIDGSTNSVSATVTVPSGACGVAVDARKNLVFVTSRGSAVTVISGA